jgi:thiamine transporter ThiT
MKFFKTPDEIIEDGEKHAKILERSPKTVFWFVSFTTIPIIAFVYSLPLSLVVGLILGFLALPEGEDGTVVKAIVAIEIVLCFIASFVSHYYLWKIFSGKNEPEEKNS